MYFSVMAAQVFIELKRLARVTQGGQERSQRRMHLGIMDMIDQCTESQQKISDKYLVVIKLYLKLIVISTLIMLLASNQAFATVIFNQLL